MTGDGHPFLTAKNRANLPGWPAAVDGQVVDSPAIVAMVYLGMLGRARDAGGSRYWVPVARATSTDRIVVGFQRSSEYARLVTDAGPQEHDDPRPRPGVMVSLRRVGKPSANVRWAQEPLAGSAERIKLTGPSSCSPIRSSSYRRPSWREQLGQAPQP